MNFKSNIKIRLRSWKGDYLHRPNTDQGVTTWSAGIGDEWEVEPTDDGKFMLKSWKGDYLHRPDDDQGVTTWGTGLGNVWSVESLEEDNKIKLKSWKGDYLHRPDTVQGVTTWKAGEGNEWVVEAAEAHDILSGGYYNLDIPGLEKAQHTYVIANYNTPNEVRFQCYGGTDTAHRNDGSVYPDDLYKPSILPPYITYGTKAIGNLALARAIACGDPGAAPRSDYNQKLGGPYLFGDNCGVIYGIQGVCHHMEARILWACDDSPCLWPPSATASFWVWYDLQMGTGFYGKDWNYWKPIFEKMKEKTSKRETLTQVDIAGLVKRSVKETLKQVDSQEFRAAINNVLPTSDAKRRTQAEVVPEKMLAFLQFKTDLDRALLHGSVSKQEYAHTLNVNFKETMTELANDMSAAEYKRMFRADPGTEFDLGIDPRKISDNLADSKLVD